MEQKNKKPESQLVYDSNLISAIFSTRGVIIAIIDASGNVVDLNQRPVCYGLQVSTF